MIMSQVKQAVSYVERDRIWAMDEFAGFVGVDLHKCSVTLVAVGPDREVIDHLTVNTKCTDKIHRFLINLPRPCWMAVESVGFIQWFIEDYSRAVDLISIAHATELERLRGKHRKNDYNSALDVAQRLARGECPLGWIADADTAHLRKLGRHWHQLSRTLSRTKHCMKSILNAHNLKGPALTGAGAHRWLLAHGHLLNEVDQWAFENFLEILIQLEIKRENLKRRIFFANRCEKFRQLTTLLKTVPGISDIHACIIAAEIGEFERFPNADALEFWAGLTPDTTESAGRTQSGHITKAGSRTLRWAVCKAAVTLCRSDAAQERTRQHLIRQTGKSKAKANVAMGRRLLRILFAMARDNRPYVCGEPTGHQKRANAARLRKQRKRAISA
jgi:transposase